jgi:hypothetical protein
MNHGHELIFRQPMTIRTYLQEMNLLDVFVEQLQRKGHRAAPRVRGSHLFEIR